MDIRSSTQSPLHNAQLSKLNSSNIFHISSEPAVKKPGIKEAVRQDQLIQEGGKWSKTPTETHRTPVTQNGVQWYLETPNINAPAAGADPIKTPAGSGFLGTNSLTAFFKSGGEKIKAVTSFLGNPMAAASKSLKSLASKFDFSKPTLSKDDLTINQLRKLSIDLSKPNLPQNDTKDSKGKVTTEGRTSKQAKYNKLMGSLPADKRNKLESEFKSSKAALPSMAGADGLGKITPEELEKWNAGNKTTA